MWKFKTFKTYDEMRDFVYKNRRKIEWYEIFINNGWAIEYRKLRFIH